MLFLPFSICADRINGNFFVKDKYFDFTKSIIAGKCTGRTPYPYLFHDEEELVHEINDEISDFVELYAVCNQGERDNFTVTYDLPNPGLEQYFSVRWITKKDGNLYRIDSLNFNLFTTKLVEIDEVMNDLSSSLLSEIIRLSDGHLASHIKWECLLDKIRTRDIQFYLKDGKWYLVFNATTNNDKVVEFQIPEYFMHGDEISERL